MNNLHLADVLLALHASKIECGIQCDNNAGWAAWIGAEDERRAEKVDLAGGVATYWLHQNAMTLYPDSDYAKNYADDGYVYSGKPVADMNHDEVLDVFDWQNFVDPRGMKLTATPDFLTLVNKATG